MGLDRPGSRNHEEPEKRVIRVKKDETQKDMAMEEAWETLYRWEWFHREQWRPGFRETKAGKWRPKVVYRFLYGLVPYSPLRTPFLAEAAIEEVRTVAMPEVEWK